MDHDNDQPVNTREREVIVTNGGASGTGIAGIVAAVIGAIVVLLLAWMLFFNGGNGDGGVESPFPDDVNVNIDDAGGDGAG